MVGCRNRIIDLINYIESLGVEVNWGKNKAQGNKGFFRVKSDKYRIDISKSLSDEEALSVLVHEFCHYIHYINDKTLKSLDFLGINSNDDLTEELISITVESIPKKTVEPLFEAQRILKDNIRDIKEQNFNLFNQFELKTKQNALKRINSKIARINRYYNSPTELFARSMELYILDNNKFKNKAPILNEIYSEFVSKNKILSEFLNFC